MKKFPLILIAFLAIQLVKAQETTVITTGVPFLLIAADARSAGMADQGVATSPDAFSQQYNPAKYAFALDKIGASVSYTPYLTELVNDISLGQVTIYDRLNEKSAFAGSLRYFSLGDITLRETYDDPGRKVTPNEFALDLSYSLKLSPQFAMGVGGRYISSSLRIADANGDASAATSFAVDVFGYYQSEEIAYDSFDGRWRVGFNFQNLGPKISYDSDKVKSNFLPANMKLGTGFDFILDEYSKLAVNLEIAKLLVPSHQFADLNRNGTIDTAEEIALRDKNDLEYNRTGWTEGIFKSFGDAPGGFKEELREFTYSVGSEYLYQDSFALRGGFFYESPDKGSRKFFSLGAGFKYNVVKIDVSYLFSASQVKNPLENTLRFSLTFNFGDKYDEY